MKIAAPGDGAYSTVPGGGYLGGWQGTSFATPLVSATVALIVANQIADERATMLVTLSGAPFFAF